MMLNFLMKKIKKIKNEHNLISEIFNNLENDLKSNSEDPKNALKENNIIKDKNSKIEKELNNAIEENKNIKR